MNQKQYMISFGSAQKKKALALGMLDLPENAITLRFI